MDFSLVKAVAQSSLPSSQRLIMLLLLNHANSDGKAWPSHATLAREAGLSERSVWAHVNSLEQSGWLVKVGNHHRVAVFQVAHPAESAASIPQPLRDHPANTSDHPAKFAVSSRNGCGLTTQEPTNIHPRTTHQETGRPSQRVEVDLSFDKAHPKPNISAEAKSETSAKTKPQPPASKPAKPDWREWNRQQTEQANGVAPLPHMPADFHTAWQGWQAYRTRRATEARISSEAIPWTRDAAQAGLRECERAASVHGWPALSARIDQAIAGNWQGLNTDKIVPSTASRRNDSANRPGRYASRHRSDSGNLPGRYAPPPPSLQSASCSMPVTTFAGAPPPSPTSHVAASTLEGEVVHGSAYFFNQLRGPAHQPGN